MISPIGGWPMRIGHSKENSKVNIASFAKFLQTVTLGQKWHKHKTLFTVSRGLLFKSNIYLVAHGLDTVSDIYLNGIKIGTSNNQFVRYKYDIKPHLREGENSIRVAFTSAPIYAKEKRDKQVARSYVIPPECPDPVRKGICYVQYIRKLQASFTWDWVRKEQMGRGKILFSFLSRPNRVQHSHLKESGRKSESKRMIQLLFEI